MMAIQKREGFEGQTLHVIPRPMLREMAHHVLLYQLTATDIGWYPRAAGHYCERPAGAPEHILLLCVAGEGWCEVDGQRFDLGPNQAAILPRDMPHRYAASEAAPWSIHWVHFTGPAADYFAHLLPDDEYTIPVAPEIVPRLEGLFRECYGAFAGSFAWQRMATITQTLHYLLGTLFFNNPAFSPVLRSSRPHNLDRTLDYMSRNLDKPLSLQDLADHAGLSRSHFSRCFKEQTGFSPIDYLINLKVQHAAMLLTFTDQPVRAVGNAVGYGDPYYFSRVFKKVLGVSPAQFRQNAG